MSSPESIDIHIQRSPHVTATDFEFLEEMVRDPRFHMYAPELDGVDDTFMTGIRKIANGDSKVYRDVMSRTDKDSAWSKSFSALFMLKKPIESFDVTQEQNDTNPVFNSFGTTGVDLGRVSALQFVEGMPARLERLPTFIRARDELIAGNITERLPEIIQENPRLRSLGSVGMLMTIGDNHILVDKILTEHGFSVTTNVIPVVGAHEKAGLMQLSGEQPTEQEILEAAAYNIVRGFADHSSTYNLRSDLNQFVDGVQLDDIRTILSTLRSGGPKGLEGLVKDKLGSTELEFGMPGKRDIPVRPKDTFERRNGQSGIRTSIF